MIGCLTQPEARYHVVISDWWIPHVTSDYSLQERPYYMHHPILVIIKIIEAVKYREKTFTFWLNQLAKIILPPENEARNDRQL
jgi:hypothetical protein